MKWHILSVPYTDPWLWQSKLNECEAYFKNNNISWQSKASGSNKRELAWFIYCSSEDLLVAKLRLG